MWGQRDGSRHRIYRYTGIRNPVIIPKTPAESVFALLPLDTGVYRTQYIATAGVGRGPLRLSGAERRLHRGTSDSLIPSVRASFGTRALIISARAEARSIDSVARSDVTAQLTPFTFLSFIGAAGRATGTRVHGQHVRLQDELRPR